MGATGVRRAAIAAGFSRHNLALKGVGSPTKNPARNSLEKKWCPSDW
jgi:hypothetical protein